MNGVEQEIIRPMVRRDVARVHEIECACFRSPWSKLALLGELKNEVALYLVMQVDGVICGYGGMWILFEEAHVTNVAILEGYRHRGRGRRLMLAMMRQAVAHDAERMTLEVRESNETAQRLYASLGFEQNGFRPRYYSDTGEGAKLLWNNNMKETLNREKL